MECEENLPVLDIFHVFTITNCTRLRIKVIRNKIMINEFLSTASRYDIVRLIFNIFSHVIECEENLPVLA